MEFEYSIPIRQMEFKQIVKYSKAKGGGRDKDNQYVCDRKEEAWLLLKASMFET